MARMFAAFVAASLSLLVAKVEAQSLVIDGPTGLWHSPNMVADIAGVVEPGPVRLGETAYDNHFLNTGKAPDWDFMIPLEPAGQDAARLDGNSVEFPASGIRVALAPETLPDVATPAQSFLLSVPEAESVLVVEPYYLFRNKLTAYRVSTFGADGSPGPRFNSLPTHALVGSPNILVAPERAGCCENMTWSIRFYDLTAGSVSTLDCPPGRCGDLILARPEGDGSMVVAMEVFETMPGLGSVVETRLAVVAPDGVTVASGRLAYAIRDATTGLVPEWTACASRVLVAKGSPYAVANLTAARKLDDGRWAFRFDSPTESRTWLVDGVSHQETPPVVFAASKTNQKKG